MYAPLYIIFYDNAILFTILRWSIIRKLLTTNLSEGLGFGIGQPGHFNISNAMFLNILQSTWGVIRFPFCYTVFKCVQSCSVSYFIWQRIRNC